MVEIEMFILKVIIFRCEISLKGRCEINFRSFFREFKRFEFWWRGWG